VQNYCPVCGRNRSRCFASVTTFIDSAANIEKLITAVVTWGVGEGSYVTKTKLLKLLYLFDIEYYRVHRQTFTAFGWKFFHLGPWAAEFDPILDELVTRGALLQHSSNNEFETAFYRSAERIDRREPFSNVRDEYILRGVLNVGHAEHGLNTRLCVLPNRTNGGWNSERAPRLFCDSTRKTRCVYKIFIRQDQG
jgi:hypothetical protein